MRQRVTIPKGYPEPEVHQAMPYWDSQVGRNCLITPARFTAFDNPDGTVTYTIDGVRQLLSDGEYREWLAQHPEYLEFEQESPQIEQEPEGV